MSQPLPEPHSTKLQSTNRWLALALVASYGLFVFAVVLIRPGGPSPVNTLALISVLGSMLSLIAFYALLGVQASRLGKSVITWVGGAILTTGFGGPLLLYWWIRGDAKKLASAPS
jgi:ABC-type Co2+ transport system permease subunit